MGTYDAERIRSFVAETTKRMRTDKSFGTNHNKATTKHIHDFVNEGRVRDHVFISDEPPIRGGTDKGPSPLEYFIAGFAFCQQVISILYASKMGIKVDSIEVDADGLVPGRGQHGFKGHKAGIAEIDYKVRIESKESKETIMKLIETVERYCPAVNTLKEPPVLKREIMLNGETIG